MSIRVAVNGFGRIGRSYLRWAWERELLGKGLEVVAVNDVWEPATLAYLLTAPGKGVDATLVYGVNHRLYDPARHRVLSAASCTTNCVVPMVKVLHAAFGLERGYLTTVHAYTNDQMVLDSPHKDLHRARSAAVNIIPTSTGAAKDGDLAGVLRYTEAPTVSRDVVGDPASCVFDAGLTPAAGTFVKIFGWYDNELGYTARLVDLTTMIDEREPDHR